MAKSKSKKKGNLNNFVHERDDEQIREIWCGEDYATASKSELRSGDDDRTAGRSELRCGDDAVTSRSDFRCGKEDNKLSWCEARYFDYMTTSRVYDVVNNNNVLNINLVPTHEESMDDASQHFLSRLQSVVYLLSLALTFHNYVNICNYYRPNLVKV
ncbi:hypothetical protein IGI04_031595 [Brassica rapa subsp. trilocularis]|uniref:Uncharacterized protein n=1 Tax=Brassica rapa subsp. trilocularis TaxID=1813537 RepID=A0ABQ7LU23_BRACM|nr:hypothetical protein IGI04_031595 [Brassica rapa subsp. trilocularis]